MFGLPYLYIDWFAFVNYIPAFRSNKRMSFKNFNGRHAGTGWDSKNKYEFQKQISRHAANVESSRTHAQPIDKCHSSDVYVCISFQEPMQCLEAHIFQRHLHIEKNHDWTCRLKLQELPSSKSIFTYTCRKHRAHFNSCQLATYLFVNF